MSFSTSHLDLPAPPRPIQTLEWYRDLAVFQWVKDGTFSDLKEPKGFSLVPWSSTVYSCWCHVGFFCCRHWHDRLWSFDTSWVIICCKLASSLGFSWRLGNHWFQEFWIFMISIFVYRIYLEPACLSYPISAILVALPGLVADLRDLGIIYVNR